MFKYRFIKIDLVTEGNFCFNFSRVLGGVVDCVNVNSSARARTNHGLREAQNVRVLTKVGTVLNCRSVILVPRGHAPFGKHQESPPLDRSNDIPFLNGFVNTID